MRTGFTNRPGIVYDETKKERFFAEDLEAFAEFVNGAYASYFTTGDFSFIFKLYGEHLSHPSYKDIASENYLWWGGHKWWISSAIGYDGDSYFHNNDDDIFDHYVGYGGYLDKDILLLSGNDAPSDDKIYGRKNNAWEEVVPVGGGASVLENQIFT